MTAETAPKPAPAQEFDPAKLSEYQQGVYQGEMAEARHDVVVSEHAAQNIKDYDYLKKTDPNFNSDLPLNVHPDNRALKDKVESREAEAQLLKNKLTKDESYAAAMEAKPKIDESVEKHAAAAELPAGLWRGRARRKLEKEARQADRDIRGLVIRGLGKYRGQKAVEAQRAFEQAAVDDEIRRAA